MDFKTKHCIVCNPEISVHRAVTYTQSGKVVKTHDDGSEDSSWVTHSHYADRAETKEANRVYQRARQAILAVTTHVPGLGLTTPATRREELLKAIAKARALVDEFNYRARYCRISFYASPTEAVRGAPNAAEGVRDRVFEATHTMREALTKFDVKTARDALYSTKRLVDVIDSPETRIELRKVRKEAADLAREVARMVKTFDGKIEDALASSMGEKLAERAATAEWNF